MNFNKTQYNCLYIFLTLVILYCIMYPPNLIEGNSQSNKKIIKNLKAGKAKIKQKILDEVKDWDSPDDLMANSDKLVQGWQYSDALDKSINLIKNPDGSSFGGDFFGSGNGSGSGSGSSWFGGSDDDDNGDKSDNGKSSSWFGGGDSDNGKSSSWFGGGDDDNGKGHKHHHKSF